MGEDALVTTPQVCGVEMSEGLGRRHVELRPNKNPEVSQDHRDHQRFWGLQGRHQV
jgi:hypothetical protein